MIGDPSLFDVIPDNVRLIGNLNYDLAIQHYPVDVKVTDGLHELFVRGSVNVLPENEFAPTVRNLGEHSLFCLYQLQC